MIIYNLLPFNKQFDEGFGAMATSYEEAAKIIENNITQNSFSIYLPLNFLYSHAIELYIKGSIIILSKKLNAPFPDTLKSEHNLKKLFEHLKSTLEKHKDKCMQYTKTNLLDDEAFIGIEKNIDYISSTDSNSTINRYPKTKNAPYDNKKSPSKDISRSFDDQCECQTYLINDNPTKKLTDILQNTTKDISSLHYCLIQTMGYGL